MSEHKMPKPSSYSPQDNSSSSYAGDVSPRDAWAALSSDPAARLIDVRTSAEWSYVGLSDLTGISKKPILLEWQVFPAMQRNEQFEAVLKGELTAQGTQADAPLYFLCRSGARSRAAAIAMTAAGFRKCFNVAGGFEGDPDDAHHRGMKNGWKAEGLPWRQG